MKLSEEKKFTLTLFLLPWIPAFILYKRGMDIWAIRVLVLFIALALISFISPAFALKFKQILEKIGHFLGKYLAIIALTIVYFIAVLPTGLLMKIVKRDRLRLKKPQLQTYWKKNENNNTDYEYQY